MSIEDIIDAKVRAAIRDEFEIIRAELRGAAPTPAAAGLLTIAQAAEQSGFSAKTIREWIGDKRLRALKAPGGREYRIRPADLEKCLTEGDGDEVDVNATAASIVASLQARK